jgi:hypothetical protein
MASGGPRRTPPPAQVVSWIAGSLASRIATPPALVARPRGSLVATNAADATQLPPQALRAGDQGQGQAARGCRLLKEPRVLAASR